MSVTQWIERVRPTLEVLSFVAIIISAPLALIELRSRAADERENARKERLSNAQRVYREVDDKFSEFIKMAVQYPEVDCYSVSGVSPADVPLTGNVLARQQLLYTYLTDVFEVAYVEYVKTNKDRKDPEVKSFYGSQWPGWEAYINKFMARKAYRAVWSEIRNEYDEDFCKFVASIASQYSAD